MGFYLFKYAVATTYINSLITVFLISVVIRKSNGQAYYTTPPTTATPQTDQPVFDPNLKHSYRDPEEAYRESSWHFREWDKYYLGTNYLGFLYSGKAEFPWVVHIRDKETYWLSDMYSIGNLISTSHVLTVCRAVTRYKCQGPVDTKCEGQPDCPCKIDRSVPYITIKEPYSLSVFYYGSFISEQDLIPAANQELKMSKWNELTGNMDVDAVLLHPLCAWSTRLVYDSALIFLAHDIPLISRWVNFMPLPIKDGHIVDNRRIQFVNEQRVICYVATIGAYMKGIVFGEDMIQNHKIKYRVYPTLWPRCDEWTAHSVNCRGDACQNYKEQKLYPPTDLRVECWETRNRIGAVCDHDRGAPVVCNGTVEGIVIRAATENYCNAGTHVVFMVQRVGAGNVLPSQAIPDIFPPRRPRRVSSSAIDNSINYSIIMVLYYCIQIL